MGSTLVEKIFAHNIGADTVRAGEIITVNVDRVMVHDIFIPFVKEKFEEMGFTKIWDPDKMVLIYDHLVPASQLDDPRHHHIGDEFCEKYGVKHVHRSDGICHQLMTEAGYVRPGDVAFGTDSHTVTYGCVGAFSTGIGYTEMASILGTGKLWVRVPETIKVIVEGTLPDKVTSKDVILRIIGDLKADGATYKSLEFSGSTFDNMSVASRMTMSNMTVEAGAKCGLFSPDEKTAEYCGIRLNDFQKSLRGDDDADYVRVMKYRAEDFVPVMACPSQVDKIKPVSQVIEDAKKIWAGAESEKVSGGDKPNPDEQIHAEGSTCAVKPLVVPGVGLIDDGSIRVDEVFIGSCTNGRLEDLQAAAAILRDRHVAPFVRLIVTPASRKIYREALADGTLDILAKAGAMITTPGCGLCCGRAGGILTDNEVVVATNNRNFLGRMGTSKVNIYLASPVTAASCAVAGKIVIPE